MLASLTSQKTELENQLNERFKAEMALNHKGNQLEQSLFDKNYEIETVKANHNGQLSNLRLELELKQKQQLTL